MGVTDQSRISVADSTNNTPMYKPPTIAPGIQKLLNIQNNNLETWKFDQEVCRRALVEMIIWDELPFSFV
uniref:Uncharacterized protein n=1 Tax=Solanum lycopersicum TaxID=4081 RepID=A0A3Q7GH18_SOLLC